MTPQVRDAIVATADASGLILPDAVVEAARNKSNVLHSLFPWNDAEAAHQHRLAIARGLIRQIEYVSITPGPIVEYEIEYVHSPRIVGREQGYVALSQAATEPAFARDILRVEIDRVESMVERAGKIAHGLKIPLPFRDFEQAIEAARTFLDKWPPPTPKRKRKT